MSRLRLTLLGGFQARLASGAPVSLPTRKAQALLAYLALRGGQPVPRGKLAALLWGASGEAQARQSLRQALTSLRRALARVRPAALRAGDEALMLDPAAIEVDALEFATLATSSSPAALERAGRLWSGDLLDGFVIDEPPFAEWLDAERTRLRSLAQRALAALMSRHEQGGALDEAAAVAHRLLALDALDESTHRALMRVHAAQGRRGAALRQYQACVDVLERELGTEPEEATKRLYREIVRRVPPGRAQPSPPPGRGTDRRPRLAPATTGEPPLIGREPELAALRLARERAWRGEGGLVTVVGASGIGKSRLVAELAATVSRDDGRALVGRCHETERVLAFRPWVEALRTILPGPDDDALARLPEVWRLELARLIPELGTPARRPSSAADSSLHLFEAVAQLMARLAAGRPTLLVLEDLHWADEMSLRLLGFVARRAAAWRLLIAGTVREEEMDAASLLRGVLRDLQREHRGQTVVLGPLGRPETSALVAALAGSRAPALDRLDDHVWALSEGNPFVAVETVRAFRAGRLRDRTDTAPMPERVRDLIAGNLERISEPARELLAVATVAGADCEFRVLAGAAGLDERVAADAVEELVRRRLLRLTGERFAVAHDRIRDVVLERVQSPRRQLLHARLARAVEERYADDLAPHYAALGVHYLAGDAWDRALPYLRAAGAQALSRLAPREAVVFHERALAAVRRLPETPETIAIGIDIRLELRAALFPLGEHEAILATLREARILAEALADDRRRARIYAYLANAYLARDLARAIDWGERAVALATSLPDAALAVTANFYLGQAHASAGDYRRAAEAAAAAVRRLDDGTDAREQPPLLALSRFWLVWCLAEIGAFADAERESARALGRAAATAEPLDLILAHLGDGLRALRQGRLHEAVASLETSLARCRQSELGVWLPAIASPLGQALALLGKSEAALPLLEEALAETAARRGAGHALRTAHVAEAVLDLGRVEHAEELATRALAVAREQRERGAEAYALRVAGEVLASRARPDLGAASDRVAAAQTIAEALGMAPLVARCRLTRAAILRRAGRIGDAGHELRQALTVLQGLAMDFWIERARGEMVTLAQERADRR